MASTGVISDFTAQSSYDVIMLHTKNLSHNISANIFL